MGDIVFSTRVPLLKPIYVCDRDNPRYTLKCMACGVVALRRDDFRRTIQELAKEGGDADTYARSSLYVYFGVCSTTMFSRGETSDS